MFGIWYFDAWNFGAAYFLNGYVSHRGSIDGGVLTARQAQVLRGKEGQMLRGREGQLLRGKEGQVLR